MPLKLVSLRSLSSEYVDSVSHLHRNTLPYSINSMLGRRHLNAIYKRMSADDNSMVVIAMIDTDVAGVVSATLDAGRLKSKLLSEASMAEKIVLIPRLLLRPAIVGEWFRSQTPHPVVYKDAVTKACLTAIAVSDNKRRSGVGRSLVEAVNRFVREKGERAYYLETRAENEGSRAFYSSLGFVEAERRGRDIVLVKEV